MRGQFVLSFGICVALVSLWLSEASLCNVDLPSGEELPSDEQQSDFGPVLSYVQALMSLLIVALLAALCNSLVVVGIAAGHGGLLLIESWASVTWQ